MKGPLYLLLAMLAALAEAPRRAAAQACNWMDEMEKTDELYAMWKIMASYGGAVIGQIEPPAEQPGATPGLGCCPCVPPPRPPAVGMCLS